KGIENFTMLIAENNLLYELRWDGHEAHFKQLNENEAHILCSVTLYTPEVIEMRKKWFAGWLQQNNDYSVERILKFHLFAGEGDDYTNVRMSRAGIVQTVSITSVQAQKMYYTDLKEQGEANFGIYTF
ncbi:MAG TPA: hypothetical protein VG603_05665, partial [Chitinophagales bacterium]|nr:hypothetical protein [Chitinophagales bacterium]